MIGGKKISRFFNKMASSLLTSGGLAFLFIFFSFFVAVIKVNIYNEESKAEQVLDSFLEIALYILAFAASSQLVMWFKKTHIGKKFKSFDEMNGSERIEYLCANFSKDSIQYQGSVKRKIHHYYYEYQGNTDISIEIKHGKEPLVNHVGFLEYVSMINCAIKWDHERKKKDQVKYIGQPILCDQMYGYNFFTNHAFDLSKISFTKITFYNRNIPHRRMSAISFGLNSEMMPIFHFDYEKIRKKQNFSLVDGCDFDKNNVSLWQFGRKVHNKMIDIKTLLRDLKKLSKNQIYYLYSQYEKFCIETKMEKDTDGFYRIVKD